MNVNMRCRTCLFFVLSVLCNMICAQVELTDCDLEISRKTNEFSTKLFYEVYKSKKGNDEFCISPLSVSWALSMTANGAQSRTMEQICEALGFSSSEMKRINSYHKKSVDRLLALDSDRVKVDVANSVWINEKFKVKKTFVKNNRKFYDAAVKRLVFDTSAVKAINDWCSRKTSGNVTDVIKDINPLTDMYVINALYFKGRWTAPFAKSRTKEDLFTKESGEQIKVNMMHQKFDTRYYEDSCVQMSAKNFGSGMFSMFFVLPKENTSMDEVAGLLADDFQKWCERSYKTEVDLSLPRFRSEFETSMKVALQQLGIKNAFIPGEADFGRISNKKIYIGDVLQKTFVNVDEEGAEAAAVTSVSFLAMAAGPPQTKIMKLDRPFFYIIRENSTGNILFIGKNGHPKE